MALTSTTLSGALGKNSNTVSLTASTGAVAGGFARVNGEYMVIVAVNGLQLDVRSRGSFGGIAVDHDVLSPVTLATLATDLAELGVLETVPVPTGLANLVNIGQDGVIPVPNRNTIYTITKATALGASSTMANPLASQDGLEVAFVSLNAIAHVVKLVTSNNGTTGGNKGTYTFPAFIGAGFKVMALRGQWVVTGNSGPVVAST